MAQDKEFSKKRGRPRKDVTPLNIELTDKYADTKDREYYKKRWNQYIQDFQDINNSSDANILDNIIDQEIIRIKLIKEINDPNKPENIKDKELMERVEKINASLPKLLETLKARRADRDKKEEGKSIIDIAREYDTNKKEQSRRDDESEELALLKKKFVEENVSSRDVNKPVEEDKETDKNE